MRRLARWYRRQQPWRAAPRCGWCGWHPPEPDGHVHGRHDPRFIGHGTYCPSRLYAAITTAAALADQWHAIECWARLSGALDLPGWADQWRHMSFALMQRADMLGVPFPVADDASELGGSR
jgi:hypothetical protein